MREVNRMGGFRLMFTGYGNFKIDLNTVFYAFFIGLLAVMLQESFDWKEGAKRVPVFVAWVTITIASISFLNHTFRKPSGLSQTKETDENNINQNERAAHLDIEIDQSLPGKTVIKRASIFLGWLVSFLLSTAVIGMLPTTFLFVIAFMRVENKEPWALVAGCSVGLTTFSWFVFDYMLALPWPRPVLTIFLPDWVEYIPSW